MAPSGSEMQKTWEIQTSLRVVIGPKTKWEHEGCQFEEMPNYLLTFVFKLFILNNKILKYLIDDKGVEYFKPLKILSTIGCMPIVMVLSQIK